METDAHPGAARVVDVRDVRRQLDLTHVIAGIVILGTLEITRSIIAPWTAFYGMMFSCGAACATTVGAERLLLRWRPAPLRGVDPSAELPGQIASALRRCHRPMLGCAPLVARLTVSGLAESGCVHSGFRVWKEASPGPVTPLDSPFEPVALNDRTAGFREFCAQLPGVPPPGLRGWWRSMPGGDRAGLIVAWCLGACAILDTLVLPWFRTGVMPAALVVLVVLVAVTFGLGALTHKPVEWFAVPGGIVVRSAKWYRGKWSLDPVRANESVLLYWADLNMLAIAAADVRCHSCRATAAEADIAFRAWSSPLPWPNRLSDLM